MFNQVASGTLGKIGVAECPARGVPPPPPVVPPVPPAAGVNTPERGAPALHVAQCCFSTSWSHHQANEQLDRRAVACGPSNPCPWRLLLSPPPRAPPLTSYARSKHAATRCGAGSAAGGPSPLGLCLLSLPARLQGLESRYVDQLCTTEHLSRRRAPPGLCFGPPPHSRRRRWQHRCRFALSLRPAS